MKNRSAIASILLALVTSAHFSSQGFAQQPEHLTNDKILQMVKDGWGEQLIVSKISKSICDCDTSTAAIGKLKAAKVSDAVVMAMIDASTSSYSETPSSQPRTPTPGSKESTDDAGPKELRQIKSPGIYLFEDGQMKEMEPTVFSGTKSNPLLGAITYGLVKTTIKAKVRGAQANLRSGNSQPVFYFVFNPEYKDSGATMAGLFWGMPATSPNEFMMVTMKPTSGSREAVLGEYGTLSGASTGARDKDIRDFAFEKLRPGLYKVSPKVPLTPGEYCFYYAAQVSGLGLAGGKIFDFGVK